MTLSTLSNEQIQATQNFRDAFSHIAPPRRSISACLTSEQEEALSSYRAAFNLKPKDVWNTAQLPSNTTEDELNLLNDFKSKLDKEGTLKNEHDIEYATDVRLLQYLRARDNNLEKSYAMFLNTLAWRKEEKPWLMEVVNDNIEKTNADARIVGFDVKGRVVVYSSFANAGKRTPRDVQVTTASVLEKSARCLNAGSPGNVMWINHFGSRHKNGFGFRDCNPAFCFSGIDIFNNHYPECLQVMIIVDPPSIFYSLWAVIKPVLPLKTQEKAMFVNSREVEKNRKTFDELFGAELSEYLLKRITLDAS
ncbi:hypothetical protein CEUSTIGMA_g10304.t1 [Chlamydomonas eustigma]|uniref:CRAL-TRIO domain-containing protein n=1 Tax=Chlamydomonas eustigma TaxID=1157962 RepID=A0A250XIG7_9CHLO|nr:hypothetical protein CEUSTIGMA_g10304.t1 [Chlamydomonas eustigma]|eukprot:GAX82878.1 hypothetical protein CEUSTIGMA_g10304.t1 [Chlamydomonas eustigma]